MRAEPVDDAGLRLVEQWLAGDPAAGAVGEFYGQAVTRWRPLLAAPARYGWIVHDDEGPVGFLDAEIVDGEAEITYYVAPPRRGQGLSRGVLELLVELVRERGATSVHASVGASDQPSLAALRAAGFSSLGPDEYGDVELSLDLRPRG